MRRAERVSLITEYVWLLESVCVCWVAIMLLGISVCEFGVSLKLVGAQNDYSPRNLFRISFLTTQFIFINFPLLARPSATHTHTHIDAHKQTNSKLKRECKKALLQTTFEQKQSFQISFQPSWVGFLWPLSFSLLPPMDDTDDACLSVCLAAWLPWCRCCHIVVVAVVVSGFGVFNATRRKWIQLIYYRVLLPLLLLFFLSGLFGCEFVCLFVCYK